MVGPIRTMHLLSNMCHIKTIETFSRCTYYRSELPQTIAATIAATLSSKLLETDVQQTSWCLRIQWERGFVFPEDNPKKKTVKMAGHSPQCLHHQTCQLSWLYWKRREHVCIFTMSLLTERPLKQVCLHGVCILIFLNVKFTIMKCVYMCKWITSCFKYLKIRHVSAHSYKNFLCYSTWWLSLLVYHSLLELFFPIKLFFFNFPPTFWVFLSGNFAVVYHWECVKMWRNLWPLGLHFLSTSAAAVELWISDKSYLIHSSISPQTLWEGFPTYSQLVYPLCASLSPPTSPCGFCCLHCGEPVSAHESVGRYRRDMLWLVDLYGLPA